jgi:glycosyltransferase involved in cell wall biosynthesis
MRILFANHTSACSGAEESLLRVVAGLREDHQLAVACPSEGPLADAVDGAEVQRLTLPAITASLRLDPVQTPRGGVQIAAAGAGLGRAARRFRADVIHANSTRTGLAAAIARALGGPPVVVRAHEHIPLTRAGRAVRAVLVRSASAIVAVSDDTARRLDEGLERPVAQRVYNSIDHGRFDPVRVEPAPLRTELGIGPDAALIGQVAQITPWKGQDTSVRALAELRRAGLDAHLVLVGEIAFGGSGVRYDNHAFLAGLKRLVAALGVGDAVHLLGRRDDVPAVLRALDLHVLPSWHEPFGLVTVESMALGTPPLVGSDGAGPELVQDGVTGRVVASRDPQAWATAARELLADGAARRRMAAAGPAAAARFSDDVHAGEMLAIYARAAQRSAGGRTAVGEAAPWPS